MKAGWTPAEACSIDIAPSTVDTAEAGSSTGGHRRDPLQGTCSCGIKRRGMQALFVIPTLPNGANLQAVSDPAEWAMGSSVLPGPAHDILA